MLKRLLLLAVIAGAVPVFADVARWRHDGVTLYVGEKCKKHCWHKDPMPYARPEIAEICCWCGEVHERKGELYKHGGFWQKERQ